MAKTTRVVMPQLGESVHEGTISKWLVKVGDKVVEFEPMLEVDTDKVNAEVPAPVTGILREILAKEGETVQAGAEIAVVEVGAEGADGKASATPEAAAPASTEKVAAEKAPPVPQKEKAPPVPQREEQAPEPPPEEEPATATAPPQPAEPEPAVPSPPRGAISKSEPARASAQGQGEGLKPATTLETGGHRYSPAVQMQASELKVDLSKVTGTGIGGRVTKKDVQAFASQPEAAPAAPTQAVTPGEGDEVVQLTRVRRLIAENMVRSKTTIPHAWQTQEADMSGVVANRSANKAAFQKQEGFSLTYLPYVIAAATSALREHRQVNATFHETELIIHRDINIGVSIGLEDTLIVPVVRRADGLSIAGIARAVNDIATRARNKQLKADDLAGATFTVNNSGTFGTLFSYSVINPGQAGILTMEAIVERPVAVEGMIGIKPMMYLCFSFDHRVLDGLQAARFLTSCRKWLEAVTAESPIY
ncbi:MAG TPA: dihydrolipoamide acetyltransferase family protein [Candidatus Dormibacteraeota bacterium]|nr:dihydrolipoamide acetyltransferase family protein [Candidatus Dormibacteraeota bacterium]